MLRSMTGYGFREESSESGILSWEIRAVNHRYMELGVRLPEELRSLEPRVREKVAKHLKRGKVDAILKINGVAGGVSDLVIDQQLVEQVVRAAENINSSISQSSGIDPLQVLTWPGVVGAAMPDHQRQQNDALELLDLALNDFVASRIREGEKTEQMIVSRVDSIEKLVDEVRKLRPDVVDRQKQKLMAKLAQLDVDVEPARLEQELVFFINKLDVDEELDRLNAHITEIRSILNRKEPVGRRLDFLIQEFNREVNTLGAKAADSNTTGCSVELKVLIEQIREQVQNIE